jgi:hypothetical protein
VKKGTCGFINLFSLLKYMFIDSWIIAWCEGHSDELYTKIENSKGLAEDFISKLVEEKGLKLKHIKVIKFSRIYRGDLCATIQTVKKVTKVTIEGKPYKHNPAIYHKIS